METKKTDIGENQLEIIYQFAPIGLALINDDLLFIMCNPALTRKLGYSSQELCSKTMMEICHPDDRLKLLYLLETARSQNVGRNEIRLIHKDTFSFWLEIIVQHLPPEPNQSGAFIAIVKNIQQRKETELEVNEIRRRLTERHETDRRKIAQELHDGPMQELHSIVYQAAGIDTANPEGLEEKLEAISKTAVRANNELRSIAYDLRPPVLSKFGLARSMQSHADEFMIQHPELKIHLELVDDKNVISEEIRLALFRIYQHAMINIIRHANATAARISLNLDGDAVTLNISDNGVGFIVPNKWIPLVRKGHFGLASTSDRVRSLGGELQIASTPGEGTQLTIRIPDYMEE